MRRSSLFLYALLLSQAVFAQQNSHTFEVSTQLSSFDYQEFWPAPQKSNESGFIPGLALSYTYRGYKVPIYARANFEYTKSRTTYDGVLIHPNGTFDPLLDHSDNYFRRFELEGGYTLRLARQLTLTAYTGYGFRSWTRLLADPGGYEENYHWSYIPIGLRGDLRISDMVMIGLNMALRPMISGSIHMSNFHDNPTMDLGNKLGSRFSLPSSVRFSQHWALGVEPWLEFSAIEGSQGHLVAGTADYVVWEPSSSTSIFGTNVTVQYGF